MWKSCVLMIKRRLDGMEDCGDELGCMKVLWVEREER